MLLFYKYCICMYIYLYLFLTSKMWQLLCLVVVYLNTKTVMLSSRDRQIRAVEDFFSADRKQKQMLLISSFFSPPCKESHIILMFVHNNLSFKHLSLRLSTIYVIVLTLQLMMGIRQTSGRTANKIQVV